MQGSRPTAENHRKERIIMQPDFSSRHKEILNQAAEDGSIPVILAGDNDFALPIAVTIRSIIDRAKTDDSYLFLILSDHISPPRKEILHDLEQVRKGIRILIFDMEELFDLFQDRFPVRLYWKRATYLRLFLPDLLPRFETVFYLDGDLLVRTDLAELFHEKQPPEIWCTAVEDCLGRIPLGQKRYMRRKLHLPADHVYFNAGVLILNLAELRKIHFSERALEIQDRLRPLYQDQDILNMLCCGHVRLLPHSWNYMLIDLPPLSPASTPEKSPDGESGSARILHYSGDRKPWAFPEQLHAEEWWTTARELPCPEEFEKYSLEQRAAFYRNRMEMYQRSLSLKLGLALTWLPRKILSALTGKQY